MASSSSSRALNAFEISLHRLILGCKNETATQNDIEGIDATKDQRQNAINHLLSAGMLKLLKEDGSSRILYKGIRIKEVKSKATLDKDTQAVLSQIEEAKNEGVWTKAIQRRTDLPQKVIAKSIKILEQQALIKPVKSVKYPTRKMYMLSHLTPSVEVTGGVWYTDNEFDTAFVKILLDHIYGYIANRTLPSSTSQCARPLYPLSEKRRFPDIHRITQWLAKSDISEVKLEVEDVQSLLSVLEFDGRVEKIPSAGALLKMDSDDEDEDMHFKRKRKRRDASDEDDEEDGKKKRLRATGTDSEDDPPLKKVVKVSKKEGKKTVKKKVTKGDSDDEDDDRGPSSSRNLYNDLDLSDVSYVYRAIRPPNDDPSMFSGSLFGGSWLAGPAHTQEASNLGALPWAEAPCVHCPQLDFCLEGGPVNASTCEYYDSWLDPDRKLLVSKVEDLQLGEAAVGIEVDAS